jgi:hypothetical protein
MPFQPTSPSKASRRRARIGNPTRAESGAGAAVCRTMGAALGVAGGASGAALGELSSNGGKLSGSSARAVSGQAVARAPAHSAKIRALGAADILLR